MGSMQYTSVSVEIILVSCWVLGKESCVASLGKKAYAQKNSCVLVTFFNTPRGKTYHYRHFKTNY
jgi:hypothetical protein